MAVIVCFKMESVVWAWPEVIWQVMQTIRGHKPIDVTSDLFNTSLSQESGVGGGGWGGRGCLWLSE